MARNRVIYQSEALYVSENAAQIASGKHKQLERVQSANYNFSISRTDINQYGQLGRLDSLVLEAPTVAADFSYYLTDGMNEKALRFADSSDFSSNAVGFVSGHLVEGSGQNLYIIASPEGQDVNIGTKTSDNYTTIALGNSYVTDYTLDASVGSLPTVSVSMEALNIRSDAQVSGSDAGFSGISSPAIQQSDGSEFTASLVTLGAPSTGDGTITALRPGDIVLDFGTASTSGTKGPIASIAGDADGSHVQSVSLSIPMSRSPLERLGSRFPFARTADFPVTASLSVSAIVNEITAANLREIIDDEVGSNITITFNDTSSTAKAKYQLKNAKLDSESFSSSIGSNKTVDLTFSVAIGGPSDGVNNVFFSGANSSPAFT